MPETIRPLRADDVADFAALCFPELPAAEAEERLREDLAAEAAGEGVTLVAEEGGRAGATAKLLRSGETGWVFNVSAHPDFRGRGIVQRLLDELASRARGMGMTRLAAHVREDNLRARRAYEKAGFKCVGQEGMRGAQLRYERPLSDHRSPVPSE
jgi:ribosomal protein S18 acetylase RimI-like enzyme